MCSHAGTTCHLETPAGGGAGQLCVQSQKNLFFSFPPSLPSHWSLSICILWRPQLTGVPGAPGRKWARSAQLACGDDDVPIVRAGMSPGARSDTDNGLPCITYAKIKPPGTHPQFLTRDPQCENWRSCQICLAELLKEQLAGIGNQLSSVTSSLNAKGLEILTSTWGRCGDILGCEDSKLRAASGPASPLPRSRRDSNRRASHSRHTQPGDQEMPHAPGRGRCTPPEGLVLGHVL